MEEFCLENHFVFELYSTGGFPLEEASELGFDIIKVSFMESIVSLCSIFFSFC
jgi:hypothetical protein